MVTTVKKNADDIENDNDNDSENKIDNYSEMTMMTTVK